mgnify:CR=1 FL=1
MIIRKGHFYAAHRNQHLRGDQCFGIHGHTYFVFAAFRTGSKDNAGVTTLFSELESRLAVVLKRFDHAILIDVEDTNLRDAIRFLETQDSQDHKTVTLDGPTSVENLAEHIFHELGGNDSLYWIKLRETNSSTFLYKESE